MSSPSTSQIPPPRQASISLNFIIVGGGLAGVACAYVLQRAGHSALVLEKHDGKFRSHGSVDSPPNMTRTLQSWGLGTLLETQGVTCSGFDFVAAKTGNIVGRTQFGEQLFQELGARFYMVQHGDLYDMIMNLAIQAGVTFMFNEPVEKVDPEAPSVTLQDGRVLKADVLVAADGRNSFLRKMVLEEEGHPIRETPSDHAIFVGTVPVSRLANDPTMLKFVEGVDMASAWMGNNSAVYGSHVHHGLEYGLELWAETNGEEFTETWDTKYRKQDLELRLAEYEPTVKKLFALAEHVRATAYVARESPQSWVHHSGRLVLVGEAAHPLQPYGSNNAALSIEDASTFGELFSHITDPSQIPVLLSSFEELREPRCSDAMLTDAGPRNAVSLPDGPLQEQRDGALLAALDIDPIDMEDEFVAETMSQFLTTFQYDAGEAVADWYSRWGGWLRNSTSPALRKGVNHTHNMNTAAFTMKRESVVVFV